MNTVEPIRKKTDITKMKKALHGRDKLLLVFGINSGLRISDLLKLKVEDVIDANGKPRKRVSIVEEKTKKTKIFVLNRSISTELKKIEYVDRAEPLFKSRNSKKTAKAVSRTRAWSILNEAAERAGVDLDGPIGTHTLRKTFGYHAYNGGTPLPVIMDILNHSSEKMTLKYIGINRETIDNVYHTINL